MNSSDSAKRLTPQHENANNLTSSSKQLSLPTPNSHTPNQSGTVIETPDGCGGTCRIRIQNMSATANLGVKLDLKQIALRCRNTEFNPRRFAAVIMRLREPRATALIFASGKMCITGTKSSHNSSLAAKRFAYIIDRLGYTPQPLIDFKVQNIVGTTDMGFPIRLEGLAYAHSAFASYEPELFPGLIYRLESPKVVFLIFVSGKMVITGAKTETALCEARRKMGPVLEEYKKVFTTPNPGALVSTANSNSTPGASAVNDNINENEDMGIRNNDDNNTSNTMLLSANTTHGQMDTDAETMRQANLDNGNQVTTGNDREMEDV